MTLGSLVGLEGVVQVQRWSRHLGGGARRIGYVLSGGKRSVGVVGGLGTGRCGRGEGWRLSVLVWHGLSPWSCVTLGSLVGLDGVVQVHQWSRHLGGGARRIGVEVLGDLLSPGQLELVRVLYN